MIKTETFCYVENGDVVEPTVPIVLASGSSPSGIIFPRPVKVGDTFIPADFSDKDLIDLSIYRIWYPPETAVAENQVYEIGNLVTSENLVLRADFVRDLTDEEIEAEKRENAYNNYKDMIVTVQEQIILESLGLLTDDEIVELNQNKENLKEFYKGSR